MKNVLANLGLFLLSIFFLFGEIFGIIHSAKHHTSKDLIISIAVPPWAWWRSLEMFWHVDYANVNWDRRLKNDVYLLYTFMSANPDESVINEFNESVEKFAKKIEKYPDDKKDYLNTAAIKYKRLMEGINYDFIECLNSISNDSINYEISSWSKHSKPILDSILVEYDVRELQRSYLLTDSSIKYLYKNKNELKEKVSNTNSFNYLFKMNIRKDFDKISRIYKLIFNSDLEIDKNLL